MENQNTRRLVMGILSYLGILSLIPFFVEKNDDFVQYHAKQGLNLCIIEVVLSVICGILSFIPIIGIIGSLLSGIIGILSLVLSILGIIAVCQGEKKDLPVVSTIKIIK